MSLQPSDDVDFDSEVPVLIIGAGAAGLTAALAAVEAGVEPVLIERDAVPSGSTALSAGLIPAAGTRFQAALGIATLVHQVPIALALMHQAGAILVLALAVVHAERLGMRRAVGAPLEFDLPTLKRDPLIPAQAGIQGQELGPRFRGDERK